MTLDEIMKAEQSAEVMKVELEAKLDQATKSNNEYRASNDDLRYRLSESERQVTQLSIAEARIKENHKTEIARLMRRSNNMQTSPGKSNEGDDAENNVETLKMIINRLETDLESKSASLKAALEDSELKTQHLKAQLLEITGKNQSMEIAEGNLRAEMDRLSETVDLMAAEASTMREKQVILQMERDKSVHALEEKSNDFLKLESKADTERARLREEIEKVFEEAAAAFEEKKGIQEEMETLQASNRYYQKELDEKNLYLADQLSKIQSMELLLLQFEGVNGSENVSAGETIKDLNRKVELRMAENKRLESELTEAKQRAIIKDNEKCQLIQAMHDLKVEAQRLSQSVVEKNSLLKSKEQEIDELFNELRCKEGECSKLRANIDSQAQEKTQTGSLNNRRLVERVDQYEGILKEKVAQVHKANERYNDVSMKYVAIEEDYKSCKERHARETRDMQARINSLKQYNEKLLQLKDSHENELDDLRKTSEGKITQLEERVEDLQTMADALEEQMKLDGGNKAELANSMSSLRRSLQERKDARGDPIALQQEIKKLKLDYNGKLKISKKQLVSLDATTRECKAQVKKLNDSILSFSKHLAANRESLKGKEHQIEKLKSEVSVEITHKETVVHENRQLKHQIESILAQANQQRSEYAASGRQIQTLKQSVIERENRIADLLSDTSNSKDRMIVQYRDLTTKHENQINDLQSQVKNNQSIIDSLSARLTEVTKVDGQAVDTQVRNVIDSDLIVAWISDMQKALKSMFDMPEVKLMNTSQFKEISSRLVDYIRRISVKFSSYRNESPWLPRMRPTLSSR